MGVVCNEKRKSVKNNMEAAKPIANRNLQGNNLEIKNSKKLKRIPPSEEGNSEQKDSNNLYKDKSINNSSSIEAKKSNKNNIIKMKIHIGKDDVNKYAKIVYNTGKNVLNIEDCNINILNELNESNTELYINNKKYKYKSYFLPEKEGIYDIELKIKILMKSCCCLFHNCHNLISLDLSSFNTHNVTNMACMFENCKKLQNLDLSSFKTQNVTIMYRMFSGCYNLQSINLSSFNTQNVTNMNGMFLECYNLKSLDLSKFNTQNVTNMACMFENCQNLQNLDLSSFNTQNATNMHGMFDECYNLQRLDLSSFNTQNVTNIKNMFGNCYKLASVVINREASNIEKMINKCKIIYV